MDLMFIYLAHPIDGGTEIATDNLVSTLGKEHVVYTPSRAFKVGRSVEPNNKIQLINSEALRLCDVLLVILDRPSTGCGMEIEHALRNGTTIVIVDVFGSWSIRLYDGHPQVIWADMESIYDLAMWDRLEDELTTQDKRRFVTWTGAGNQPARAYHDDAGFDLAYSGEKPLQIQPGEAVDVPVDVAIEWPDGMWGLLIGRSSTFRNLGLMVNPAIIDTGYRGDLFSVVRNISNTTREIQPGGRVAQIVPMVNVARTMEFEWAPGLNNSERGTSGFGSSGT